MFLFACLRGIIEVKMPISFRSKCFYFYLTDESVYSKIKICKNGLIYALQFFKLYNLNDRNEET